MTLKFEGLKAKWNFRTVLNLALFSKVWKYERKYRTKICDFTVHVFVRYPFRTFDLKLVRKNWVLYFWGPQNKIACRRNFLTRKYEYKYRTKMCDVTVQAGAMKLVLWRHWCMELRCIEWPQRTNFTAPGCISKENTENLKSRLLVRESEEIETGCDAYVRSTLSSSP